MIRPGTLEIDESRQDSVSRLTILFDSIKVRSSSYQRVCINVGPRETPLSFSSS